MGTRRPASAATTAVRRRRIMAMAGAVVIASTAVVTLSTFNYLRCEDSPLRLNTDIDQVRTFTKSDSLCIGIVRKQEWGQLGINSAVLNLLSSGNEDATERSDAVTVAVVGALRPTVDPRMRERILRQLNGVVLAQHESKWLGRPAHVVLVDTGGAADTSGTGAADTSGTAALKRA